MFVIPKIDQALAIQQLARRPRPLARKRNIIKTELIYLPSYLFTVTIETKKGISSHEQVCVDGIEGLFAFFEKVEFAQSVNSPCRKYDFIISQQQAEKIASEEYRRQLLKQSLKKKVFAVVKSIEFNKKIYYPYWLGYFKRKKALDFEVIDAISAAKQGAKMKPLFIHLLLQDKQ